MGVVVRVRFADDGSWLTDHIGSDEATGVSVFCGVPLPMGAAAAEQACTADGAWLSGSRVTGSDALESGCWYVRTMCRLPCEPVAEGRCPARTESGRRRYARLNDLFRKESLLKLIPRLSDCNVCIRMILTRRSRRNVRSVSTRSGGKDGGAGLPGGGNRGESGKYRTVFGQSTKRTAPRRRFAGNKNIFWRYNT